MRKPICHIFAAGDYYGNLTTCKDDLVIAADAGYNHLKRLGVEPDILLGDFDTIGQIPSHLKNVIRFPAEKDYTDTHLAINEGKAREYTQFAIYGAIGGKRLEHTIANLQLASDCAKNGYDMLLTDGKTFVYTLHNSNIEFEKAHHGKISLFCMSDKAIGVTVEGLKYTLDNAELSNGFPLGVSNEFIGEKAKISVQDGTLMIISEFMRSNK